MKFCLFVYKVVYFLHIIIFGILLFYYRCRAPIASLDCMEEFSGTTAQLDFGIQFLFLFLFVVVCEPVCKQIWRYKYQFFITINPTFADITFEIKNRAVPIHHSSSNHRSFF